MDAENLVIDDRRDREAVEALDELLPELEGVPALAFIVEAVDAVDRAALVVASEEEEVLRVLDLVGEHEADDFEVLLAAIDVVAEEEVVGFGREAADLENSEQVNKLAVNIPRNNQWRVQLNQIWLRDEYLLTLLDEHLNLTLS